MNARAYRRPAGGNAMSEARYNIYKNLDELNKLPRDEAEAIFRDCCGSSEWARQMADARPFSMLDDLYRTAEQKWFALKPADWLEAFASHLKVDSTAQSLSKTGDSAQGSMGERTAAEMADESVLNDLAEANRLYLDKFGFIFIVCATGKTAGEMLAICRARLGNSIETELDLAATEQSKITSIKLDRLLER